MFLYVILLKGRKVVIDDQNRLIVKLIFSKDGKIVYKEEDDICKVYITTSILIKTKTDSMDIMTYGEKLHGYMGILSFRLFVRGVINSKCAPVFLYFNSFHIPNMEQTKTSSKR